MNTTDTYKAGLEAALAVLHSLTDDKGCAADNALASSHDYDRIQVAKAVAEHGAAVDGYLAVSKLLNDYRKSVGR